MSSSQDSSGLQAVEEKSETPTAYKTANSDILAQSAEEKQSPVQEPSEDVDAHSAQELCEYFRDMLVQTQQRFAMMSDQIMKKIDDMGERLNHLESDINGLITQTMLEDPNK